MSEKNKVPKSAGSQRKKLCIKYLENNGNIGNKMIIVLISGLQDHGGDFFFSSIFSKFL